MPLRRFFEHGLFGGRDVKVPPAENADALRLLTGADHRRDRSIKVLSDLNHLFQPARTGLPEVYATIETTIAPEVLEIVEGWIRDRQVPLNPMQNRRDS